jgi:hypothetical protein
VESGEGCSGPRVGAGSLEIHSDSLKPLGLGSAANRPRWDLAPTPERSSACGVVRSQAFPFPLIHRHAVYARPAPGSRPRCTICLRLTESASSEGHPLHANGGGRANNPHTAGAPLVVTELF